MNTNNPQNKIGAILNWIAIGVFLVAIISYGLGFPVWLGLCFVGGFVELLGWLMLIHNY